MTEATLVLPFRGREVLLAMKKRGFGAGRWNGMGGKVRDGETVTAAVIRETLEEVGITPQLGSAIGHITFHNSSKGDWVVHVFRTTAWQGLPVETEEMKPQWFSVDTLPFDQMWPDDRVWMPWVLASRAFRAEFWFGEQDKTIAKHKIVEARP